MYTNFPLRLLHNIPPEAAHAIVIHSLPIVRCLLPGAPSTQGYTWRGLHFANRIGLAAGFDKNGDAIDGLAACGFGFIEIGTVTPKPQPGNPYPRIFRLSSDGALVNRMGFNNKGVAYAVKKIKTATTTIVKGINIGKNLATPIEAAVDDYIYCLEAVFSCADYIVVNISSPNTPGLRNLQYGQLAAQMLETLAKHRNNLVATFDCNPPVLIKISPDLQQTQICDIVNLAMDMGFDGVIATNTTINRPHNLRDKSTSQEQGGLSGKPLYSQALETVKQCAPLIGQGRMLIGVGGVSSCEDYQAMRQVGADLVQLYTGFVYQGIALVQTLARQT